MGQLQKVGKNNTQVTKDGDETRVILHGTTAVKWDAKKITLNTGGFYTHTTKTRMMQASNEYDLGFYVYQKNGAWFVTFRGETRPFVDGMVLERQ